ncbi:MAG: hypothetical protein HYT87_15660 [Nitrospirae bacterium]|nr:hypothetical protein [Nitrospirota bacterium]
MKSRRVGSVVIGGLAGALIACGAVNAEETKEGKQKEPETEWVKKPGSEKREFIHRVLIGVQPEVSWIGTKPERSQSWRLGFPIGVLPAPELELALIPTMYRADSSIDDFVAFELRGRATYVVNAFEGSYLLGAQLGEVFRDGDNWESGDAIVGMRYLASRQAVFDFGATLGWLFVEEQSPFVFGLSAALRLGF